MADAVRRVPLPALLVIKSVPAVWQRQRRLAHLNRSAPPPFEKIRAVAGDAGYQICPRAFSNADILHTKP